MKKIGGACEKTLRLIDNNENEDIEMLMAQFSACKALAKENEFKKHGTLPFYQVFNFHRKRYICCVI
jgi:hypothetical protein